MLEKMEALQKNETWDLVFPPPDKNIVGQGGLTKSNKIQVRWFFYIEVQTACSKRLLSRVRKLTWLLKAMKKSMVYIMPRRHVQSSCSKWYHSHPLTFSTGPTLIPVRRQERFPSRRSQRRGRGQPPGYEDSIHPDFLCKLSKALYGLNYPDLKNSPKSLFLTRRVSKLPEAKGPP